MPSPRLEIRSVEGDRQKAQALLDALALEGIAAQVSFDPIDPEAPGPFLYVYTDAMAEIPGFCGEIERTVARDVALVAAYTTDGLYLDGRAAHVELADWDGRDRTFADFRDLVRLCRTLVGVPSLRGLSLDELEEERYASAVAVVGAPAPAPRRAPPPLILPPYQPSARRDVPDIGAAEPSRPFDRLLKDHMPGPRRSETTCSSERAVGTGTPEPLPRPRPPARPSPPPPARGSRGGGGSSIVPWLVAAVGIGAAIYWWRDLAAACAALFKLFGASVPPAANTSDDLVDVSVFAPESGQAGTEVLVQVFLHELSAAEAAEGLAKEADPDAQRRGVATLATPLAFGQRVDIVVEAPGLTIDEPAQHLVWYGLPRACQFGVTLPANAAARSYPVKVRVISNSVPIGALRFSLKVGAPAAQVAVRGDSATRYRRAFLSYASPDRAEVLKRAQGLKAAGLGFFQDVLSLEPGERWERRLYEEIDRCDLFLLFWSSSAAMSEWVIREAQHALERRRVSDTDAPDITPVVLEGPPIPVPPDSLKEIHFNDPLRYVIAAVESEGR